MADTRDARPPAAIVRITTFQAAPGRMPALVAAAHANAEAARRSPGCLSAEVCADADDDDRVVVVSRWASEAALRTFLDWHEGLAHESASGAAAARPRSTHHRVLDPTIPS